MIEVRSVFSSGTGLEDNRLEQALDIVNGIEHALVSNTVEVSLDWDTVQILRTALEEAIDERE